jgi:hypothetical protein
VEKLAQKCAATSSIFKKLRKVKNRQSGEYSLKLVTLLTAE